MVIFVINSDLSTIFPGISPIFPAVLHPLFSLLPVIVRLFPYLVPEWNQRTFATRVNNRHCDLSLHVFLIQQISLYLSYYQIHPVKILLCWPKVLYEFWWEGKVSALPNCFGQRVNTLPLFWSFLSHLIPETS